MTVNINCVTSIHLWINCWKQQYEEGMGLTEHSEGA